YAVGARLEAVTRRFGWAAERTDAPCALRFFVLLLPRRGGAGAGVHLAGAVEEDAPVDDDRGGREIAAHLCRRLQLDGLRGGRVALVVAQAGHGPHLDVRLHLGALADDQLVGRDDLAGELAVDADGTLED